MSGPIPPTHTRLTTLPFLFPSQTRSGIISVNPWVVQHVGENTDIQHFVESYTHRSVIVNFQDEQNSLLDILRGPQTSASTSQLFSSLSQTQLHVSMPSRVMNHIVESLLLTKLVEHTRYITCVFNYCCTTFYHPSTSVASSDY